MGWGNGAMVSPKLSKLISQVNPNPFYLFHWLVVMKMPQEECCQFPLVTPMSAMTKMK